MNRRERRARIALFHKHRNNPLELERLRRMERPARPQMNGSEPEIKAPPGETFWIPTGVPGEAIALRDASDVDLAQMALRVQQQIPQLQAQMNAAISAAVNMLSQLNATMNLVQYEMDRRKKSIQIVRPIPARVV